MNTDGMFHVTWGFLISSAWIMFWFGIFNQAIFDPRKRPVAYAASVSGFYLALLFLVKILS